MIQELNQIEIDQISGGRCGTRPPMTTMAVGEEDGGGVITTQAVGEEDGGGVVTTQAVGEEDGGAATTLAIGEEDAAGLLSSLKSRLPFGRF
jgi:hypothetical protein